MRLILRKAVDLKPSGERDPQSVLDFNLGPLPTTEVEVVIITRNSRRYVVERVPAPWDAVGG